MHTKCSWSQLYVRVCGGCLRSVLPGVDIIRRATLTKSTLITEMFVVAPDNRMIVATPHEAGAACGAAANCQLYTLKHDYDCTRSVAGCLCVPMCVCVCVCVCACVCVCVCVCGANVYWCFSELLFPKQSLAYKMWRHFLSFLHEIQNCYPHTKSHNLNVLYQLSF